VDRRRAWGAHRDRGTAVVHAPSLERALVGSASLAGDDATAGVGEFTEQAKLILQGIQ